MTTRRPRFPGKGQKAGLGPLGRSKKGNTVTAQSRDNDNDHDDVFSFQEEVGGVLGNIKMPTDLSTRVNKMKSPEQRAKKKRSANRKKHNPDPNPLDVAEKAQGGLGPRPQRQQVQRGPRLNSQETFQGSIPRKGDLKGNSSRRSSGGGMNGDHHRSSHGGTNARRPSPSHNSARHPQDRRRPSTSTGRGRRTNTLGDFCSEVTNGVRERSQATQPEVYDLCNDDDEHHDPGNDTTITEHSDEDEEVAKRAVSSNRKRKSPTKPSPASSKESSLANSSREEDSPAASSSSGTPAASSASTNTSTDTSKNHGQDSSDEEELEVVHPKKQSRDSSRRAPNSSSSFGSSNAAYGSTDLYPGASDESEQDETGFNICQTLNGISNEPFGGGTPSSVAHKPPQKKARKAANKKMTPETRNKSTTPSSNHSRGSSFTNNSMSNASKAGITFSKVNARNVKKRRKRKGNAINSPGKSLASYSAGLDDDSIHSFASDELSSGSNKRSSHRRRQAASNHSGGVRPNPYAAVPSRRQSISRAAKTKAKMPEFEDLVDTDEDDNTTLAAQGTSRRIKQTKRKQKDAIRIAIGKKLFTSQCTIRYHRTKTSGVIVLSMRGKGDKVEHKINLDDESVLEIKYFLSKDDDDQAGATISIDFDESEQMTFLALKVKPNDKNDLVKYSNSYQPEKSDGADSKRYIAIEFRSDQEFLDLLRDLKKDESLGAFVCDSTSQLSSDEAEVYGKSLFQAARKERADRESNVGSPRVRRKRRKNRGSKNSNEVLLVFPFGADEDKIDKAAEVLTEASNTDAVERIEDIAMAASATLKSTDEEAMTSSSELADNEDGKGDDDKDESAGKTKSRAHFLTIRDEDYDRLQPGEFLNDTLIDFWFQWIWRKDRHVNGDVHFFTSHFYTALAKGGPEAVTSWTAKKNIDIFTKKYIFIPVNLSLHWSLCVVVNPGAILNEVEGYGPSCDDTMDDELLPCILFFDSLKAHKKTVITNKVKNWLNSEWQRLEKPKAENAEELVNPFTCTKKSMQVFTPRVPYQDNSWDCGVFVCRYGYGLFRLREHSVTYLDRIDKFQTLITDNEQFNFDRDDIVRIRGEMATLLDNLSALFKEWKKANDEAEKEAEEDSKKPAARQLILEDDTVSQTKVSESITTKPVAEQVEGPSATAVDDGVSAESKETDTVKPNDEPIPQVAEPDMKEARTNESGDVEMSDGDGDQPSLSTQPENANADGIVDMDVDEETSEQKTAMDIEAVGPVDENASSVDENADMQSTTAQPENVNADGIDVDEETSEQKTAMDTEDVDPVEENAMPVDENADMQDQSTTATFPSAPVKQEEDQYGGGEGFQGEHDEDMVGEAESEEQSDDRAASDSFQVVDI